MPRKIIKARVNVPKTNLALAAYEMLKQDIFAFRLLPGQRFSENAVSEKLGMSRTPVREALHKLEREGYIQVASHSGWYVSPFDFALFDQLYEVRQMMELNAITRVCALEVLPDLEDLRSAWLVPVEQRLRDDDEVAALDEAFHSRLVEAAGNSELSKLYQGVVQRIRIIRRLDFTQENRIDSTYEEHGRILRALLRRRADQASLLLKTHIETSRGEVRKITLHKLFLAQQGP